MEWTLYMYVYTWVYFMYGMNTATVWCTYDVCFKMRNSKYHSGTPHAQAHAIVVHYLSWSCRKAGCMYQACRHCRTEAWRELYRRQSRMVDSLWCMYHHLQCILRDKAKQFSNTYIHIYVRICTHTLWSIWYGYVYIYICVCVYIY
jgi:hypothetical protein